MYTARERQVLVLLAQGKTDREIGAELGIHPGSVSRNVSRLLLKLQCQNRVQLAIHWHSQSTATAA